jgi:hypothetical protein
MVTAIKLLLAAFIGAGAQAAATPDAEPAAAPGEGVTVVELFTSQGCPMCPGANELLEELASEDGDMLALAYGVGYWDVYGWRDTFARPEFADRQQAYVDTGEARRVYTPQFVINGSPKKLRFSAERVTAAVAEAERLPIQISAERVNDRIELRLLGEARDTPAQIWAVAYHPGRETVTPDEGPNAGREVSHFNMVRALEFASDWSGGAMVMELDAPGDGLASAILVQDGEGGPIITAARVETP